MKTDNNYKQSIVWLGSKLQFQLLYSHFLLINACVESIKYVMKEQVIGFETGTTQIGLQSKIDMKKLDVK